MAVLLVVLSAPRASVAVKIGDITHLQGCRTNKLIGMGFVVGLKGTGDGGKYLPTMRLLAQGYKNFGIPVLTLDELKNAKNVAVVERWPYRGEGLVRGCFSLRQIIVCTPELIKAIIQLADEHDTMVQTHLAEGTYEIDFSKEHYDARPPGPAVHGPVSWNGSCP